MPTGAHNRCVCMILQCLHEVVVVTPIALAVAIGRACQKQGGDSERNLAERWQAQTQAGGGEVLPGAQRLQG